MSPQWSRCLSNRMCILLLCTVLCCFKTARAHAQTAESTVVRSLLSNGVHLLLKRERTTEVVAITVMVRMPSDANPLEVATGELVSRAIFFGSMNTTFELIARSVSQVGGDLTTLHTPDYVAVSCVTVPEQLSEAIYLLCEALKNAEFAPDALVRAAASFQTEQLHLVEQPFDRAYEACAATLRGVSSPDPTLFSRVTQQSAQRYFLQRYVPNRTVVAVVGKFDPESVQKQFDDQMVDYTRLPPRYPAFPPERRTVSGMTKTTVRPAEGDTAYAVVGVHAPTVDSPDYPAFTVLHALLGGGHASRLFRRVRDRQGIGYEVGALYQVDRSDPMVAYLQWNIRRHAAAVARPEDALELLTAQLDAVLTDPPTEAEVARARNVAIGRDALRHERAQERAFLLAWYEASGLHFTFDAELPKLLAAVTRGDILRVARTYLSIRSSALSVPPGK